MDKAEKKFLKQQICGLGSSLEGFRQGLDYLVLDIEIRGNKKALQIIKKRLIVVDRYLYDAVKVAMGGKSDLSQSATECDEMHSKQKKDRKKYGRSHAGNGV